MEKQQNMPSGYEKNRKIIGKYQRFSLNIFSLCDKIFNELKYFLNS